MSIKNSSLSLNGRQPISITKNDALATTARCIRDADLLARANELPLPRLLAVALADAPLYRIAVGFESEITAGGIPPHAVAYYNQLYQAAFQLNLDVRDNPSMLDAVSQLSSASVAKIRQAVETIAYYGWEVECADPSFVPLRSSLEVFAGHLVFLCDGNLDLAWGGDRTAIWRFFADFQHICGTEVPVDQVIECWRGVTRDFAGKRAKDTRYPAILLRAEKAELRAWRSIMASLQSDRA